MKVLVTLSFLLFCFCSLAQTPFVQQNNSKQKALVKIDTASPKLAEQFNEIVKHIGNLSLPTTASLIGDSTNTVIQIQELSDAITRKSGEYNELKSTKNKLQDEANDLSVTVAKLKENNEEDRKQKRQLQEKIEELNKHIESLEKTLQSREQERDDLKKKLENVQKSLDQTIYEKYILAANTTELQFEIFGHSIEQSNSAINELQKSLNTLKEGVIQPQLSDVIVNQDDNANIRKLDVDMILDVQNGLNTMDNVKIQLKELNAQLDIYKDIRQRLGVLISIGKMDGLNDVLSKELKKETDVRTDIDKGLKNLRKAIDDAQVKIIALDTKVKTNKDLIARILSNYKANKETPEENLKTIAGITQPLSEQGKLVPNISILGFKGVSDENSITAAQFKLFVAPASADKNYLNSTYRLFIPEASNYGFMADFSFGFIPSTKSYKLNSDTKQPVKKVGLNLSTYYLSKELVASKDSSVFHTGMLQFKTGLQYVVIGRTLSLYANVNPFFFTDGTEDFKENFHYTRSLQSFVDFGLNCYLNLSQEKSGGFFIDFDLGFIVVGDDVKNIVPTNDPLIPRIKIALVKGFAF